MCVLTFSTNSYEKFLNLSTVHRDIIKNVHISVFKSSTNYPCHILNKLELSWQTVQKFRYQTSVQWEPSCSMRTDRHDESKSRSSQFYESAQELPEDYRIYWLEHSDFNMKLTTHIKLCQVSTELNIKLCSRNKPSALQQSAACYNIGSTDQLPTDPPTVLDSYGTWRL